ncbi:XRE family transcriptional regulator [bacterium]|nr:MAG: XRE family transcriptional regulator [bacterium]
MKSKGITNDLFIDCLEGLSIGFDTSSKLKHSIENRKQSKITQEEVSVLTGRSIATIKRFESGKVDSLFLFCYYIESF